MVFSSFITYQKNCFCVMVHVPREYKNVASEKDIKTKLDEVGVSTWETYSTDLLFEIANKIFLLGLNIDITHQSDTTVLISVTPSPKYLN